MHRPLYKTPAFMILLALASVGFLVVMRPFYGAIFWAITLAILFWPMHQRILARMPQRPALASSLTLLACLLLAIIPAIALAISLVAEVAQAYASLRSGGPTDFNSIMQRGIDATPTTLRQWLEGSGAGIFEIVRERLSSAATDIAQFLLARMLVVGQSTLMLTVNFILVLYLLFFFFRDGPRLVTMLRNAVPMENNLLDQLARNFANVVNATIKGNMVVAVIQGGLGGILFWALGIQGALLWGVVMAVLSLLPAVGTWLVWGPVAIYLLATGSVVKGVIMIAVGVGVISIIDNLLRPVLVGRQTKMPDYIVLLSTFGGLSLFGITGFVVGPVIASLFLAVWGLFVADEAREAGHATSTELAQADVAPETPA